MSGSGAWGTGSWGTGTWGGLAGAGGGPLMFVGAYAVDTNTVQVQLSAPPLALSPIAAGDALNPATWTVTRDDTGFEFTVLAVSQVSSDVFNVRTLEKLAGYLIEHTIDSATLVDPGGNPVVPPTSANFVGVEAQVQPFENAGVVDFDLANPQTPLSGTPGTLRTNAAGDYETEAGKPLVEKLITRAITTALGSFFHLPDYGFGLGPKQNVTPAKLGRIKADLIFVVEAIPQVDAADVKLSFDNASGILTVTTNATLQNNGQQVQVINRIPTRVTTLG